MNTPTLLPLFPEQPLPLDGRLMKLTQLPPDDQLHSDPPTAALVRSVKRFGVLVPIILTRQGDVIDGIRRIKAARKAGLTDIVAYVVAKDAVEPRALKILLNELRSQNLSSTLDAIEALQAQGHTQADIIEATGLDPARYRRVCGLLRLIPPLRTALATGQMRESTAEDCSRLDPHRQHALLPILEEHGKLQRTDVRAQREARRESATAELPDVLFGTPGVREALPVEPALLRTVLLDFVRWLSVPGMQPALGVAQEQLVDAYLATTPLEVQNEREMA